MNHQTTIVINGRSVLITEKELTFEEIVALSGLPAGPNILFTVTFRKAHGHQPEGSLVQGGGPVKVQEGTAFSVSCTTRS